MFASAKNSLFASPVCALTMHTVALGVVGGLIACSSVNLAHAASRLEQPVLADLVTDQVVEQNTRERQTDQLIIKYKDHSKPMSTKAGAAQKLDGQRDSFLKGAEARFGVQLKQFRQMHSGAHVFKLSKALSHADMYAMAAHLKASDPNIEYAEPDRIMHTASATNDARYGDMWQLFESTAGIRAPLAWDLSTGAGVNVAVIDTGYRPHADLVGNIVGGYDMISDKATANDGGGRDTDAMDPGTWNPKDFIGGWCKTATPAQDSSWHGTHVAGTIAAVGNNSVGTVGVAYNAKILPVRALGRCGGYDSDIIDAIVWATGGTVAGVPVNNYAAKVVNISAGANGSCGNTLQSTINDALSRNAVIIAAAMNSAQDTVNVYPANCSGVIAVSAVSRAGARASFSNFGTGVTIAAPGENILSTYNTGLTTPGADSYDYDSGTSMAAPHVSGVVALMLSRNPNLTPDQIKNKLIASATPFPVACDKNYCGAGILNAYAAVLSAAGVTTLPRYVGSTSIINGTLGSATEADWYMLDLPVNATLTARLTPNASSNYVLTEYRSNLTQLATKSAGTGLMSDITITNTSGATTRRYIKVSYNSGGTGAVNGKYTLSLQF